MNAHAKMVTLVCINLIFQLFVTTMILLSCPYHLDYEIVAFYCLKVPYIVYPNAGRKWDGNSKSWISQSSESDDGSRDIIDNIGNWMKLGTNIIGGCCQVGPDIIRRICTTMMLEMYDAVQARMIEEEQDSNPDEEWSSVLRRLEKPSENDQRKNRTEDERFAFTLINLDQ